MNSEYFTEAQAEEARGHQTLVNSGEQRITAGVKTTIRLVDHRKKRQNESMMMLLVLWNCYCNNIECRDR